MSFFSFPEDGHWSEADDGVVFSVAIGAYEGVVRIPRIVLRRMAGYALTAEQCVEFYHLHRSRFERAAEARLRRRLLEDDGNITLTGRDLRPAHAH